LTDDRVVSDTDPTTSTTGRAARSTIGFVMSTCGGVASTVNDAEPRPVLPAPSAIVAATV
jgi:hypothetical protein